MNRLEQWAACYKALSEPLRIRLICLVAEAKDICVCDLMVITGVSQSMVSRHLAYLRNSGWVEARREKLWIHYSIAPQEDRLAETILKSLQEHGPQSQQIKEDLAALAELKQSEHSC
jgi:ArsR family transcriptional regulator, arsenate/arsenite/antimonite-responsive transcriptional repressor